MCMELHDDEREADYQALLASVDMVETVDYEIWHTYPGDTTLSFGDHIKYKAGMLR